MATKNTTSRGASRPRLGRVGIGLLAGVITLVTVRGLRIRQARRAAERARLAGGLPRVVVLGGGAGGLFCALALKDAPVETLVIDRVNHYLYEALIYQVATGQLDEEDVSLPLRDALARIPNATVLMAEVNGLDLERHEVHLRDRPHSVLYDYLVIATGLEPNYLGHDDWAEHAMPLKTLADAVTLRDHVLTKLEEAELSDDPAAHPELSTFVLVGGGPTGVEMAASLVEMLQATTTRDFKRFDPRRARVTLLEAGPRLLPTFTPEVSQKVRARLEALGVEILVNHPVESIDADGVIVEGKRIASKSVVWTAGMRATPIGGLARVAMDREGRILVGPDLTVPGHPEVFAIGDVAHAEQNGAPLPGLSPVALEEAEYAARAIMRAVGGRPTGRPFRYVDRGTLATVGRDYGVWEALRGRVRMTGLPAKLVWVVAHFLLQVPAGDRARMLGKWTFGSLTTRLRARVITGPDSREMEQREPQPAETTKEYTAVGSRDR